MAPPRRNTTPANSALAGGGLDRETELVLEGIRRGGRGGGRGPGMGRGGQGGTSALPTGRNNPQGRPVEDVAVRTRDPNEFEGETRAPQGAGGGGGVPERDPEPDPAVEEIEEFAGPPGGLIDDVMAGWREDVDPYWTQAQQGVDDYASSLTGFAEDYRNSGMATLDPLRGTADELLGVYEQGGLTDVTRAQLEANRRNADQFVRANREAALQDLAERGMAGGGAEVLALQGDRAAAADRMNIQDLEAAAFGQRSALDALESAGQLQSDIGGVERGLHGEVLGAQAHGAEAGLDLSRHLSDMGTGLATSLHKETFRNIGNAFRDAAGQVPGATNTVIKATGEPVKDAQDTGIGLLPGVEDAPMPGAGPVGAPNQPVVDPVNTGGGAGTIAGGGLDLGGTVGGAIAGAWPQDGGSGGGSTTPDPARNDQLGFNGYVGPTDEELETYG